MVPIFKGKGDIRECNSYRGIKLMSHTMTLWEKMIEARLREITNIADNQFGFRPGKSTTEPIFVLRMLQEKYREKSPHYIRSINACVGYKTSLVKGIDTIKSKAFSGVVDRPLH